MIWVLAAVAGLLLGSFLNVCIYRLPRDLSVVRPRSFCPHCNRTLAWYDNIPLLSYLLLRARCRWCGGPIALRYPAVEAAAAALIVGAVAKFGLTGEALRLALFSALLIGLIFSDLESRILPDEFTLGGAVTGLLLAYAAPIQPLLALLVIPPSWGPRWSSLGEATLGVAVTAGVLWVTALLYEKVRRREGMGLGDVKMAAMIGAFLGLYGAMVALLAASLAGSALGLIYIKLARKKASEYELPFGSFMGLGALATAFLDWARL